MKSASIPYKETNRFSEIVTDYLDENERLTSFVSEFPSIDTLQKAAKKRTFDANVRKILCDAVEKNYLRLGVPVPDSLELFRKDKTITITTGHQLNIFGGPLYSIYKIASVINLCRQLNEKDGLCAVPIFWLASEDHDFEEIASVNVHEKKYTWEHSYGPAVGSIDCAGVSELLDKIKNDFPDLIGPSAQQEIKSYYTSDNLADAHFKLMSALFSDTELIVVDADTSELKKLFVPQILNEISVGVQRDVETTNNQLEGLYKAQAHARDINLFYLMDKSRERIIKSGDSFVTADLAMSWTKNELENEVRAYPERFSPNVIMRPMYQETILPNIAYVGGGGELTYWLQLKLAFENSGIQFPILILRQSLLIIEEKIARKIEQLGLTTNDIFKNRHVLLEKARQDEFGDVHLEKHLSKLNEIYNAIKEEGSAIDLNLERSVESTRVDVENRIHSLEKKFKRAQKRQLEVYTSRLETIDAALFPKGGLQERNASVLEYYSVIKAQLPEIIEVCNPLDKTFKLLEV